MIRLKATISSNEGDDVQPQQRDDSSVVSGKFVEAGETVSVDRASRSEPAGDDLSAGIDTVGVCGGRFGCAWHDQRRFQFVGRWIGSRLSWSRAAPM